MVLTRKRCRAKNPSACSDPRCPELRSPDHLLAKAISSGNFDNYISAREDQAKRLKAVFLQKASMATEWDRLWVNDREEDKNLQIALEPIIDSKYPKDTSVIERYSSWEDIESDFRPVEGIFLKLSDNGGPYNEKSLPGFSVSEFYVSPGLRGQGIGAHLMKTMTVHADENGLAMELVPTNSGDGRLQEGEEGWEEASLAHRTRLIAFYERNGFKVNPFYHYMGKRDEETGYPTDYLTHKPYLPDEEERAKFTPKAERILSDHSMYLRFPNGEYPTGWLRKVAKKDRAK